MKSVASICLKFLENFVLFFFPNKCLVCRIFIDKHGSFCHNCWHKISFISHVYCKICGNRISIADNTGYICATCIKEPPNFTLARFLFVFNDNVAYFLYKFKYYDDTNFAKNFAKLFITRYKRDFEDVDVIIPVPMHWTKRLYRKYNPAEILAKLIATTLSKKFIIDGLIKVKLTKSQTSLTKQQRLVNIKNSITINPSYLFKNKKILLIDDVYTTGVTAHLCTQILLNGYEAKEVKFFALAKTEKNIC